MHKINSLYPEAYAKFNNQIYKFAGTNENEEQVYKEKVTLDQNKSKDESVIKNRLEKDVALANEYRKHFIFD